MVNRGLTNMMIRKTILLIAAFAIVGGIIGYSQIFCPGGQCVITGSWPGGAAIGGMLGYVIASA